jgi:hypothetical protein
MDSAARGVVGFVAVQDGLGSGGEGTAPAAAPGPAEIVHAPTIGKIERVPLREVWQHEAHNLTTWLEENIDVLNDATRSI